MRVIVTFPLLFFFFNSQSQNHEDQKVKGFLDFNGYYDSRDHSEVTINMLSNFPSTRIQYFSLTNITGTKGEKADLSTYFSEQNLRWRVSKKSPFYINHQFVLRDGNNNDAMRIGIRWVANQQSFLLKTTKKLHLHYALAVFALQYGYNQTERLFTQLEHVYKITLLNGRLYLGGFADQNMRRIGDAIKTDWVTEHQLGLRVIDQFFLVTEYRINQYLNNPSGWGFGFEYKITF